ncbi:DUF5994 family protein [Amycolatopsis sulphurea]
MTATEPPRHAPRLRLKPEAPTTGYVDGAWWPRSVSACPSGPANAERAQTQQREQGGCHG